MQHKFHTNVRPLIFIGMPLIVLCAIILIFFFWQKLHPTKADSIGATILEVTAFGAVPNDEQPDTEAIRRAMAALPAEGGTIHFSSGTFITDGRIDLRSRLRLQGESDKENHRTIIKRSPASPVMPSGTTLLGIQGQEFITITGLSFDLNHSSGFSRAIHLRNIASHDIVIDNNRFYDTNPDKSEYGKDKFAIAIGYLFTSGVNTAGNQVENITISNNTSDNDMQLTGAGGTGIRNLQIIDNVIRDFRHNGVGLTTFLDDAYFENITVARNVFDGGQSIGIYIGEDGDHARGRRGRMKNITIEGNSIKGLNWEFGSGILIRALEAEMSNVVVRNNIVTGNPQRIQIGIRFEYGKDWDRVAGAPHHWFDSVQIVGNILNDVRYGLSLNSLRSAVIEKNQCAGCFNGIHAVNSNDIVLTENKLSVLRSGILLNGVVNATVRSNSITSKPSTSSVTAGIALDTRAGLLNADGQPTIPPIVSAIIEHNTITDIPTSQAKHYALVQVGTGTHTIDVRNNSFCGSLLKPLLMESGKLSSRINNACDTPPDEADSKGIPVPFDPDEGQTIPDTSPVEQVLVTEKDLAQESTVAMPAQGDAAQRSGNTPTKRPTTTVTAPPRKQISASPIPSVSSKEDVHSTKKQVKTSFIDACLEVLYSAGLFTYFTVNNFFDMIVRFVR